MQKVMKNTILTTENLTKIYGETRAAQNINIHIREGEIYGLIGRNGAGKTTIMRMLSGLSSPSEGSFTLYGSQGRNAKKHHTKVGALIENPGLYPKLSAYDNLKIKCIAMGVPRAKTDAYINELLTLVGLSDTGKKKAGSFSLGMRQRLGIALALVGDPQLIILDEPINGLDPQGIVEIRQTLEKLRDEKDITIMISSHILDELGKIADAYGIIHHGELIDEFTTDELEQRCGEYVTVKAADTEAAMQVLRNEGYTALELDRNGSIRVSERLEESGKMMAALVKAGVDVSEVFVTKLSLEDYYLNITGGKNND